MNFNENNFYEMQNIISESEIVRFFENTKYIENFYKIDYKLFVNIFQECNDITKKKLIEKIDINYLVLLVTNNFININRIWDNEIIFDDFNYTVEILIKNNLLKIALYDIKDYKFMKNVDNINYYNLYDVLISIKDNINKLKIFLNGINYVFLDLLISKMNDNMIKFLLKNINFLARLDLTGNLFTLNTTAQFNEIKISKLQIVLLIGTSYEKLIIDKIFDFEINFIRNIINHLSNDNFITFFNKSSIDQFYQYVDIINHYKLNLIINSNTNKHILNCILKNTNIINLIFIIPKLNIDQIIDATYELSDERVICISKNLNYEHNNYLNYLYNNIFEFSDIISQISKQMLCFLIMNNSIKNNIILNFNKLNNSQILILLNFLNSEDIFKCLKVVDFDKKNMILTNLNSDQIIPFSDFIDRKLDLYKDQIDNFRERILFKSISLFIKLKLSPKNQLLIKNIE